MIKLCAFADEASNDINEQIEALKSNNLSLIEVRSIDKKSVVNFTDEEVLHYKNAFDKSGIKVWSIGSPIGKVDIKEDFDLYLKKVKRVCEIALLFGTTRVRCFSFYNAYDDKDEVIKRLKAIVDIGKSYGVDFCHENEKDIYGDVSERVLELAKGIDGLKLVYDPANYLQCNENATIALENTLPYTDYFHIKDVAKDGTLVPAGYGEGNISGLCKAVRTKDTVFTVEPHLKVFDAFSQIDKGEIKTNFKFTSNRQAFDFAVESIKKVLLEVGYREVDGGYEI